MIAYFPELYPDELFYSTVARYYSHLYPSYNMAIEKLCINKNSRIDIEFGLKALNKETRSFFEKTYGLRSILLNHTMFLQYAMFETNDRRMQAEAILLDGEGDIQSALRFPKNKNGTRFLRYCPLCFNEDKQKYGRHIGIKHIKLEVLMYAINTDVFYIILILKLVLSHLQGYG